MGEVWKMKILTVLLLMLACNAFAQSKNGFDLRGSLVPPDQILPGGPNRDGLRVCVRGGERDRFTFKVQSCLLARVLILC